MIGRGWGIARMQQKIELPQKNKCEQNIYFSIFLFIDDAENASLYLGLFSLYFPSIFSLLKNERMPRLKKDFLADAAIKT